MSNSLPTPFQQYIHKSRYSRYLWDENRREDYHETVYRYVEFFKNYVKTKHSFENDQLFYDITQAILGLEAMPSMRCLMTAGKALERENVAGFNCSYIAVDSLRSFDEILYILMNGTGVGFSVEEKATSKLPEIADEFHDSSVVITVADSKMGWSVALKELIALLVQGQIPSWDLSDIRPAGAPLKTFGGRASGPGPLDDLFRFVVKTFKGAAGRKLTTVECHDLVCKIAEIVVVGGVRRSALISISDLSDDRMRHAKSGQWWENNVQRALANNSALYREKPDIGLFMEEWLSLYNSKSGERGIFNRDAARKQALKYFETLGRDYDWDFGTNPCGEILLRSRQFCNLTEVVIRSTDTVESLVRKVRLATIMGTFQSCLTNYRYISKKWKANSEEERLLGVSLTGIMDCPLTSGTMSMNKTRKLLRHLREVAEATNAEFADLLGIQRSKAITTVKPSGTVSQLVDSASGIHPRHSAFYIRAVRSDKKDPLARMMMDLGFPCEDDITKPDHTSVFYFPVKSPEGALTRHDVSALQHLELWSVYKSEWTHHNPSITVSVREHEWLDTGAWVYRNFDQVGGLSFLPLTDHVYKQAPYTDCSEDEYHTLAAKLPTQIDWSLLSKYENSDQTEGTQTLACVAGHCEL